ncbi:MAG: FHA domain-containing protein [Blastocatellia bacterium]
MNDPREETVTGREIIESITSSMRQWIEAPPRRPPPHLVRVHLHSTDFARLEGVFRELQEEAGRELRECLDTLNGSRQDSRFGCLSWWLLGRSAGRWLDGWRSRLPLCLQRAQVWPLIEPEGGWQITFHHQEDLVGRPGEIIIETIHSGPLSVPVPGSGGSAKSVQMIHRTKHPDRANAKGEPADASSSSGGETRHLTVRERLAPTHWVSKRGGDQPVFARIEFEVRGRRKSYPMTKRSIVVGRGSKEVQPDLHLPSLPGISREHFRIRMQEGIFLILDLSTFGTMIDGHPLPNSLTRAGHDPTQTDHWVALPRRCQITLASVLSLEFIAEEER